MATKYSSSSVERALSEATRKLSFDDMKEKVAVWSLETNSTIVHHNLRHKVASYWINHQCPQHTQRIYSPPCILRLTLIFHAGQLMAHATSIRVNKSRESN